MLETRHLRVYIILSDNQWSVQRRQMYVANLTALHIQKFTFILLITTRKNILFDS
jgi:hypothetical protein